MIQLKCLEGSKAFKRGKVYLGVAKNNHKGSYYKVEGENGRSYLCKADKFEVVVVEVTEATPVEENITVYNLDLPLGKRLKAVKDLQLKKGDVVTLEFNDGQRTTAKVERVGYMNRQTKDNKTIDRFYIEDEIGYCWNLYTAKTIRIDYRNPKSKKVLTDDLKQFNLALEIELARLVARERFTERRARVSARIEAYKVKYQEDLREAREKIAGRKSKYTVKQALEIVLKDMGYTIGCYDKFISSLTTANLKEVLHAVRFGDATDLVIRQNMKDYVISIDFVEGEVDFTTYTKAEYIDRFGSEKFEE